MLVGYWPEASLNQLPCEALTWHLFTFPAEQTRENRGQNKTERLSLCNPISGVTSCHFAMFFSLDARH